MPAGVCLLPPPDFAGISFNYRMGIRFRPVRGRTRGNPARIGLFFMSNIDQINDSKAALLDFKTKVWHFKTFVNMPHKIIGLFTGNQCLGSESLIYDPVLDENRRIDEINSNFHVLAWDGEKLVATEAQKPYHHDDLDDLFEFELSNGQSFVASMHHKILTPSGFCSLSEVPVGSPVFLPPSTLESCRSTQPSDERHLSQIIGDFQYDYLAYSHLDGERLRLAPDIVRAYFPSLIGVPEHRELVFSHRDDRDSKEKRILNSLFDHLSNQDDLVPTEGHVFGILYHDDGTGPKRTLVEFQDAFLCDDESIQEPQYNGEVHQSANLSGGVQVSSYKPSFDSVNNLLLTNLSYKKRDYKWDFGVPRYHNYYHAGIIHHNSMKTSSICFQYFLRIMGQHPIPKKNVVYFECSRRGVDDPAPHGRFAWNIGGEKLPWYEAGTYNMQTVPKDGKCRVCGDPVVVHVRKNKKIRLCSETLPGDKESVADDGSQTAETKNTVYPELKKWLPRFLIKRDITFRNPAMIVHDPFKGLELNGFKNPMTDIVFDFLSYSQTVQAGAGVQRMSIFVDEEPPKPFWDEQLPRLIAEDGDILLGLTPAQEMTWTYDEIFENAQVYFRTDAVVEFLNSIDKNTKFKQVMKTSSTKGMGVLQAATDDNPTLGKAQIEEIFENVDDPDVLATRRYGIHRQVSGRIFKFFDYKVHVKEFEDYFPDGIFHDWNHYLMIDYHPHVRWAVVWMALSPENEAFVWQEWNPDPERIVTRKMAKEIALMSGDYRFQCCLIDPRAEETQTNTGTSTVDDLNQAFWEFKKEGICETHYWETWDTKGERGREVLRGRIKHAVYCKRPFNNKTPQRHVPTIWVSNRCRETARSLKQWRLESRKRAASNVDKERSEKPIQKFSHFCTALEAVFKDNRCRPPLRAYRPQREHRKRFQGGARY